MATPSPSSEGSVFLTVLSASGTGYSALPISSIGLSAALTLDAITFVGLQFLPLLSGMILDGEAFTLDAPKAPLPLFAVGVTWNPATPFDFATTTDPIVVLP
ncbi:MAG: hypothetical protein AAFZ65_19840 [Planctomycetota bacterium]